MQNGDHFVLKSFGVFYICIYMQPSCSCWTLKYFIISYRCANLYLSFHLYNIDIKVDIQMQMAQLVLGAIVQLWFEL